MGRMPHTLEHNVEGNGWAAKTNPCSSTQAVEDCHDAEQIYFEPHGIPHKRIGESSLPPMLEASAIMHLSHFWHEFGEGENDVLLAISPGLMPDFRILQPLLSMVGDPLAPELAELGELGVACDFRDRLLEGAASAAVRKPLEDRDAHRCFYTALPPWLAPIKSFKKIVVFVADPRYSIMREMLVWNHIRRYCGLEEVEFEVADYLKGYLQLKSAAHLAGEEVLRLAQWADQEHLQPDKVKLVYVVDFVADPDAAMRDLASFLEVTEEWRVQMTCDRLLAERNIGLFFRRGNSTEIDHMLSLMRIFEDTLSLMPPDAKAAWQHQVSLWPQAQNRRMAKLGFSLQEHELDLALSLSGLKVSVKHELGVCKPCGFFFRNSCRSGENCSFCHALEHEDNLVYRPSKKKRDKQKRQAQLLERLRTPSPSGMSS
eukprot:TRINITY_DN16632_c0_g1_i2.p1 TRINITY_DN16632_c0_g1~~TRINITY_DN16632_c0_g1_i2.p1  ORF type:complete len:429 (+),score=69.55 TRINITY_DN16632_c0_g1_i2:85-1371(+)